MLHPLRFCTAIDNGPFLLRPAVSYLAGRNFLYSGITTLSTRLFIQPQGQYFFTNSLMVLTSSLAKCGRGNCVPYYNR